MLNTIMYVWENEDGLLCINRIAKPKCQKFEACTFVDIAEEVPSCMSHFPKGLPALIMYSSFQVDGNINQFDTDPKYAQHIIGQGFNRDYHLLIRYSADCWSESCWYDESVLSPIRDKSRIKQYSNELAQLKE